MNKTIDEMNLFELSELKSIAKSIDNKYSNELTTYSIINNDAYFNNLTQSEKELFEKKRKLSELIERLNNKIEENIFNFYV